MKILPAYPSYFVAVYGKARVLIGSLEAIFLALTVNYQFSASNSK